MRLNDGDYVSKQYLTTSNLNVRTSVWQANLPGRSPQDLAIKALREVEPRRILEIGSGTGYFALRMTEELGCEVIATDSSAVSYTHLDVYKRQGIRFSDIREHLSSAKSIVLRSDNVHDQETSIIGAWNQPADEHHIPQIVLAPGGAIEKI